MTPLAPGATIGILGGGQLGRMLAIAAAQLGYRTHVYAPEATGPAHDVTGQWTCGAYEDSAALAHFAASVDVVTYEFENVDPACVAALAAWVPVAPSARSLEVARFRPAEKELARMLGGATAPYRAVASLTELDAALRDIGVPAILKTCSMGYDGKGQARIVTRADAAAAWAAIGGRGPAIVEAEVGFAAEFSILLVRAYDGAVVLWDAPANVHRGGILRTSCVPLDSRFDDQVAAAGRLAAAIARHLDHVGVLACEFFATDGGPLFNEMAPRVHNSGHWTIEGTDCSQFENHVRAICGLPLGRTRRRAAAVAMDNLIGDDVAQWPAILAEPGAHLHLYGKTVRPGRKMGHVTRLMPVTGAT